MSILYMRKREVLRSEKLFVWDKGVRFSPKTSGVYVFYNKDRQVIYIGSTNNIRETFTQYFDTNFSMDPRKQETKYYKRVSSENWKAQEIALLEEHSKVFGDIPKYNTPLAPEKTVDYTKAFNFYEDVNKPLFIQALTLVDFWKKLKIVPISSIEFHFNRGDFARWIQDIHKEEPLVKGIQQIQSTGEDLRQDLLNLSNPASPLLVPSKCPKC
ncbi:MAG: GIY-YIG nuclease family protein, partial [Candidatus Bathyarchaeota archaeon]